MDIKEVQAFITENAKNKEVQKYIKGLITVDGVNEFLETTDGKAVMQPKLDKHFTTSLETWREHNLQGLIDESVNAEIAKRYPEETEEQKRLKVIEKDLITEKKARIKADMQMKAIETATEKGLPVDLAKYFVLDDEEKTTTALTAFETAWTKKIEDVVETKFKQSSRNPGKSAEDTKGLLSKETVRGYTQSEVLANLDLIRKSQVHW